ncbi:RNA polymerase sigma factor (sigma-70 family) [Mumia flava]|uniref:RNA polymerase sigma factor (Sigma-70 family) n=1 Tax=Mumia flava TaxID=1348852 RepID=A0A2M9B8G5_9ACTN|nr:sigma factor [Mumia flava]PJJ54218.1 RNA polymerase sigma factor (sigma-70 family) [Mumia flava]
MLDSCRSPDVDLGDALDVFLCHRLRLERIAARIVRDAGTAEDVLQEAWVRWQRTDRARITNPAAFLTTTTRNLAINVVQSAARRHEATTAAVPEARPRLGTPPDPFDRAADVEDAITVLMERVTSTELAAYVLRRGLDYPYRDVARILRTSVSGARQLVRRAQVHLACEPVRDVDTVERDRLVRAFLAATRTGERADLERLLAQRARRVRRRRATIRPVAPTARVPERWRRPVVATPV